MIDFETSPLTAVETRILGVLVEKQYATPDTYPLTVNALSAGCSQKTSRHPVMTLAEADLLPALEDLKHRSLVIESYGASGRVLRYAHNLAKVLGVGQPMLALLASLMLRGPLTAGELRTTSDRMYHFADTSSVEAYLEDMITRAAVPLVTRLARQPGEREARWAQLLSGPVVAAAGTGEPPAAESAGDQVPRAELERLRAEVAELRERLDRLESALGS
ncbi:MAG: DUF480 domain-containing protein [Betaproteobacteria bacterium]|nr:DUF480 domain-containing protein [Betaproteobacteria bacterium]